MYSDSYKGSAPATVYEMENTIGYSSWDRSKSTMHLLGEFLGEYDYTVPQPMFECTALSSRAGDPYPSQCGLYFNHLMHYTAKNGGGRNLVRVKNPTTRIMLMCLTDANDVNAYQYYFRPCYTSGTTATYSSFTRARVGNHTKGSAILFADGHASTELMTFWMNGDTANAKLFDPSVN